MVKKKKKPGKKKSKKMDAKLISTKQKYEIRDAAKAMGTTKSEVVKGVKTVGRSRKKVKEYVHSRTDKGW
jgi:transposase-like protein